MNMHKRIRLTPLARKEIWQHYGTGNWTIVALAREFRVSRPTIYKVIDRARKQEFVSPYSPDLNPIEQKWAQAKALRKRNHCSIEEIFTLNQFM